MLATLLVILGITSRLIVHTSQFTAILAVAMFAGMYLSRRQALLVPVLVMIITDIILGFHDTMVFTWGSMFLISFLGTALKKHKSFVTVLSGSILSACIFFVVTNLGAWPTLYPLTLNGLGQCFTMAIPFFRSTLVSTVAYSLVLYLGYEWLHQRAKNTALIKLF